MNTFYSSVDIWCAPPTRMVHWRSPKQKTTLSLNASLGQVHCHQSLYRTTTRTSLGLVAVKKQVSCKVHLNMISTDVSLYNMFGIGLYEMKGYKDP